MIHSGKGKKEPGGKKKRWVRRSIAVVGLIVAVGIAWLGIAQRNNLKALYLAITSNAESLEQKQAEQDKKQEDILQQYGLSKPSASQSQEGEEAAGTQTVPTDSPEPQETSDPSGSAATPPAQTPAPTVKPSQPTDSSEEDQLQMQLQGCIDRLYQAESRYREFLNEMVESTKREFWSLPKDQQVKEKKLEIVQSKVDVLIAQEKQCDAEVEAILAEIQTILKEQGKSTALVSEIRAYYEDSKANWKAAKMTELYS